MEASSLLLSAWFLAVQFVDSVAVYNQLALLAARHVQVVHQAVARILVVPVALVVHARALVTAFPLPVVARITPSSVRLNPGARQVIGVHRLNPA
jgi:hypothetical protein